MYTSSWGLLVSEAVQCCSIRITTRRHNPEDPGLNLHRHENLISRPYIWSNVLFTLFAGDIARRTITKLYWISEIIHLLVIIWGPGLAQSVYRLDDRGSLPGLGNKEIFSFSHCVQTGSGAPHIPLSNEYQGLFPWNWSVKLTAHYLLVQRLRMRGAIPPLSHTFSWRGA